MKEFITPKNLCIVGVTLLLCGLFFRNYNSCNSFYISHREIINILVQIMVFVAAACAAFANIKMMKANLIMASVAKEEIKTLKRNHDYSIAPIIQFTGSSFSKNNVNIKNCTSNLAIKVTVFAKLNNILYISNSCILEKNTGSRLSLRRTSCISDEFNRIYSQHKGSFIGFEEEIDNFLKDDNCFFIVYVDVEGKIHGTSLRCLACSTQPCTHRDEFSHVAFADTDVKDYLLYYIPIEQHFYILSEGN